ncbi:efflux RND transporter periplasmic adaptor subunit [Methylomonas denitrificans]|uniref:Multidrug efflux pump subunit AcrA (Membrane-fusion protein) n=1 Tax=Methylomonas methanica TaxID=421 RepID=A0ABY2CKF7_METMH|nr:membrane fusion protein MtrC [Methylomonas denitrificans]TCV77412.1 multidrug efflux pump subunit AcrA (membrane-fusion protein) [Methylomonas methanica]
MNPAHPNHKPSTCRLLLSALLLLAGNLPAAESTSPPAKIEHPVKESDLTKVVLTAEAVNRLGIVTTTVEKRPLTRTRLFGGEITLPALNASANSNSQSVYTILPSLAPAELVRLAQSQIDADGQVDQAKVQVQAAQQVLNRTEQMRRDKVGTERSVDDAKAQVGMAEAALKTAHARRDLLGPALLDVNNRSTFWVRVPVYVDDLSGLNASAQARVGGLKDSPENVSRPAVPVAAPPSANPAAATVDLFYAVKNSDTALRPGQRVGVSIPLHSDDENLVVPWSAIVHDVSGGGWVYQVLETNMYMRRRVQVLRVVDNQAAVTGDIVAGIEVVSTGVAELFGTEFGVGK